MNVDDFAGKQRGIDADKLARHLVALVMLKKNSVAFVLDRIAAGNDVDQQSPIGDAIERGRHSRGDGRRLQTGTHGNEIPQPLGQRRERRCNHPGILAAPPGRQQHAEIAELVGSLGDLPQIRQRDRARANRGAEVAAVAMGRQEPKDIGLGRRDDRHEAGFLTTLETTICFGTSPRP